MQKKELHKLVFKFEKLVKKYKTSCKAVTSQFKTSLRHQIFLVDYLLKFIVWVICYNLYIL